MLVKVATVYDLRYKRRGRRGVNYAHVLSHADAHLREVSPGDAPVAFRLDTGRKEPTDVRLVDGRCHWPVVMNRSSPASRHHLALDEMMGFIGRQDEYSMSRLGLFGWPHADRHYGPPDDIREVMACSEEASVLRVQKTFAAMVTCDGIVYREGPEPYYALTHLGDGAFELHSTGDPSFSRERWAVEREHLEGLTFNALNRKEALLKADQLDRHVLGRSTGHIQVLMPSAVRFDPGLAAFESAKNMLLAAYRDPATAMTPEAQESATSRLDEISDFLKNNPTSQPGVCEDLAEPLARSEAYLGPPAAAAFVDAIARLRRERRDLSPEDLDALAMVGP